MQGRLEDLSVSDIIQIIFLSRRTGVLEVTEKTGRSTILFVDGLIVNAASPAEPDLTTYLQNAYLGEDSLPFLRKKEAEGVPAGTAALELSLLSKDELEKAIVERIRKIVAPMLSNRSGEFSFTLADSISPMDMEYEPLRLFGEKGFTPQRILATDGAKLKPLRGLAETVSAAKKLRRGPEPAAPSGTLPPVIEQAPFQEEALEAGQSLDSLLESADLEPTEEEILMRKEPARFSVGSATTQALEQTKPARERTIVVIEPDPLVRVSLRRAFGKQGVNTLQFGSTEDAMKPVQELVAQNRFFVTVLDGQTYSGNALSMLQYVKRMNRRLPVIVVHGDMEAPMRRRFADTGADVFTRRPADQVLRSPTAQAELDIFSGELIDLAEKAYLVWEQMSAGLGEAEQRGAQFYEMSEREKSGRGIGLLKQLITELSEPGDVDQISQTILRLSAEYLDRAVLFAAEAGGFVSLGATGVEGAAENIRIPRDQPSVLRDVAESGRSHRGKLRRDAANELLINSLGRSVPTETVVLPVLNEQEVVGVLYGDNAANQTPIGNLSGLEIFLSQAGFALQSALAS